MTILVTATMCHAQIAFVREGSLYVLPVSRNGSSIRAHTAFFVTKLWPLTGDDNIRFGWTPNGQIAVEHYVDAWNDKPRFGLPTTRPISRIWLVEAKPHCRLKPLADGERTSFSPNGKYIAYVREHPNSPAKDARIESHAFVRKLSGGPEIDLGVNTDEPTWGPRSDRLALVLNNGDNDSVVVRSFPGNETISTLRGSLNPIELAFSPNGEWLGVHFHLSRPLTGHFIVDLSTGRELPIRCPNKYAPPVLEDWAPDSRYLLCSWRIMDTENDGCAIKEYVALTHWPSGEGRLLGEGEDASFSADGNSVFWLAQSRRGSNYGLVACDLRRNIRRTVVSGIQGYSVFQSHPSFSQLRRYVWGPGVRI